MYSLRLLGSVALVAVIAVGGGAFWWTQVRAGKTEIVSVAEPAAMNLSASPGVPGDQTAQTRSGVLAAAPGQVLHEPIVIGPCSLAPFEEQEVSAQAEGLLQSIAVKLGQKVSRGDILARLDDRLLRPQVELLRIKAASESAKQIARAQLREAEEKARAAQGLRDRDAIARMDYESSRLQRERYQGEMKKAEEEQEMARKELTRMLCLLEQYEIRAGISGEVTRILKHEGETVRPSEPLFNVAHFDRLLVEGLCKVQEAHLLRAGLRAVVEPETRGEQITELRGHTGAVCALAVSPDGRLLASAAEDRTVALWTWPEAARYALLNHPAEVYAVAFAPRTNGESGYRLLTGAADGRARLWSLSGQGGTSSPTVLPIEHDGAIRAVAFSADGRWCATGGEDRRIAIWDWSQGRLLYWLRAQAETACAHQGAVTSLHFTPDGYLVSAGRDNTLKVWKLTQECAELIITHSGRTGEVAQPGISPDGRRILFDHGEELRILDRGDGSNLGLLRGQRQGRFHGLALFAPSGRLVLTGASSGRLQLWKAPADPETVRFVRGSPATCPSEGDRQAEPARVARLGDLGGQEIRHFLPPGAAAQGCAAFSTDESVFFTAGSDKVIRAWQVPPAAEVAAALEAEIVYVGNQVERGTDMVRIRAEMLNPSDPGRRLKPGTFVNLRVYSEMAGGR